MKHIFLDMDGVLVDFDNMVLKRGGKLWVDMSSEERKEFWKNFDAKWFSEADPLPHYDWIVAHCLENFDRVRILTALPVHRKDIAWQCVHAKIEWVHKHIGHHIPVTFGPYASDKQKHCCGTQNSILIDDNIKNIEQWEARGGLAFWHDHTSVGTTITNLKLVKHHFCGDKQ